MRMTLIGLPVRTTPRTARSFGLSRHWRIRSVSSGTCRLAPGRWLAAGCLFRLPQQPEFSLMIPLTIWCPSGRELRDGGPAVLQAETILSAALEQSEGAASRRRLEKRNRRYQTVIRPGRGRAGWRWRRRGLGEARVRSDGRSAVSRWPVRQELATPPCITLRVTAQGIQSRSVQRAARQFCLRHHPHWLRFSSRLRRPCRPPRPGQPGYCQDVRGEMNELSCNGTTVAYCP